MSIIMMVTKYSFSEVFFLCLSVGWAGALEFCSVQREGVKDEGSGEIMSVWSKLAREETETRGCWEYRCPVNILGIREQET